MEEGGRMEAGHTHTHTQGLGGGWAGRLLPPEVKAQCLLGKSRFAGVNQGAASKGEPGCIRA